MIVLQLYSTVLIYFTSVNTDKSTVIIVERTGTWWYQVLLPASFGNFAALKI
jgi:hypothetical protein